MAILTTAGIVLSLLFEALRFFDQDLPVFDFLFGIEWSPQTAIRADQVAASEGCLRRHPAVRRHPADQLHRHAGGRADRPVERDLPVGIRRARGSAPAAKPVLEVLAGIPTVVYGFFAALTVAPLIRDWPVRARPQTWPRESALAAGVVMGIMIIPFVSQICRTT